MDYFVTCQKPVCKKCVLNEFLIGHLRYHCLRIFDKRSPRTVHWIPEVPRKTENGPLVLRQGLVPLPTVQPRFGIVICQAFLDS